MSSMLIIDWKLTAMMTGMRSLRSNNHAYNGDAIATPMTYTALMIPASAQLS